MHKKVCLGLGLMISIFMVSPVYTSNLARQYIPNVAGSLTTNTLAGTKTAYVNFRDVFGNKPLVNVLALSLAPSTPQTDSYKKICFDYMRDESKKRQLLASSKSLPHQRALMEEFLILTQGPDEDFLGLLRRTSPSLLLGIFVSAAVWEKLNLKETSAYSFTFKNGILENPLIFPAGKVPRFKESRPYELH